ncbi:MAG: hypothetical protein HRT61_10255 [Ekhidna sp.]|nr:hypothetical protein [Ekhidna sp.]
MRKLYDWPVSIKPKAAIVLSPSNSVDGAISRNGYENNIPQAGSRNQIRLEFAPREAIDGHWYAWLLNQARSALWKVPVFNTPQLATSDEMDAQVQQFSTGTPFSTSEKFSSGYGFKYQPTVDLVDNVLEGNTTLKLDMSRHPDVLTYGKVFGLGRSTYHVDEIEYDGNIATIECRTPFRRDYDASTIDQLVSLRPSLICQMKDVSSFIALFEPAGIVRPGSLILNEVIDEQFL